MSVYMCEATRCRASDKKNILNISLFIAEKTKIRSVHYLLTIIKFYTIVKHCTFFQNVNVNVEGMGHLGFSLVQGVEVGQALLLATLQVLAEAAHGRHAAQNVLHQCPLPSSLHHYFSSCQAPDNEGKVSSMCCTPVQ